jgi:hypothetical protein
VVPRLDVSFDQFKRSIADWEIHPVTLDDESIGAVLVNGPEVHACINGGYGRWVRRAQLRILHRVMEKHGYAQTHATTEAGREFVDRLGFKPYGDAFRRYKDGH